MRPHTGCHAGGCRLLPCTLGQERAGQETSAAQTTVRRSCIGTASMSRTGGCYGNAVDTVHKAIKAGLSWQSSGSTRRAADTAVTRARSWGEGHPHLAFIVELRSASFSVTTRGPPVAISSVADYLIGLIGRRFLLAGSTADGDFQFDKVAEGGVQRAHRRKREPAACGCGSLDRDQGDRSAGTAG